MVACCFRLIFILFINILTTNLCNICKKQSSTYWLLQGEHCVHVVFNISKLNASEFAVQGADQFVASFW